MLWLIPTALAQTPPLLTTDATVTVLDNGLTVILEESRRTDTVALHLRFGVGSRDELDGERGCAHLFEHLMFEGSANVPGANFDIWLTQAGGGNNAWTSEDTTAYHMTFPAGASELALFLESDRLGFLSAGVTEESVANQRDVVLQERAEGYAEPHGRDWDAFSRLMWPVGHPYHVPVIGTVADVAGFTVEGTQDFWERHYRPDNAVLALVGNFDAEEMLARVQWWFSDVPARPTPEAPRVTEVAVPQTSANGMLEDAIEDWGLWMGWSVPDGLHPDAAALEILSYILSYGRGTRLDDALYYKRRIANETWAWLSPGEVGSQFIIYTASVKSRIPKMDRMIEAVLADIIKNPPTEAEMKRTHAVMMAETLDSLELPEDRAEQLTDCMVSYGRPDCFEETWQRYAAVTSEDVVRVTSQWLTPERKTTLSVIPEGYGGALPDAVSVELP